MLSMLLLYAANVAEKAKEEEGSMGELNALFLLA